MIGTSHRFRTTISAPREYEQLENAGTVYGRQPTPALLPSSRLCTWAGREVV
ncbi:unnamed protein product, partial [Staurois parvus]